MSWRAALRLETRASPLQGPRLREELRQIEPQLPEVLPYIWEFPSWSGLCPRDGAGPGSKTRNLQIVSMLIGFAVASLSTSLWAFGKMQGALNGHEFFAISFRTNLILLALLCPIFLFLSPGLSFFGDAPISPWDLLAPMLAQVLATGGGISLLIASVCQASARVLKSSLAPAWAHLVLSAGPFVGLLALNLLSSNW